MSPYAWSVAAVLMAGGSGVSAVLAVWLWTLPVKPTEPEAPVVTVRAVSGAPDLIEGGNRG